jgi:hypothetical protein
MVGGTGPLGKLGRFVWTYQFGEDGPVDSETLGIGEDEVVHSVQDRSLLGMMETLGGEMVLAMERLLTRVRVVRGGSEVLFDTGWGRNSEFQL